MKFKYLVVNILIQKLFYDVVCYSYVRGRSSDHFYY